MDTTAPAQGRTALLAPVMSRLARWRVPLVLISVLGIEGLLLLNIIDPAYVATVEEGATWMWIGGLAAFPVAAGLILVHRPQNRVGWALGAGRGGGLSRAHCVHELVRRSLHRCSLLR